MAKKSKGAGTKKPVINEDANMYLKEIKDAFKDEKYKYREFLRVMKDFQIRRIDIKGVMARVEKLFQRHKELLLKFNKFLPDGFEIKYPPKKAKIPVMSIEDAKNYLGKVKIRFQCQLYVYDLFLDIMSMYKNKEKNLEEIYKMVTSLFKDHPDLIDGFMIFLP
ncbi:paired amphipathic helix protein Sin3-like 3 [Vicia villosa]|uniref:paired amphipathic helix protein Sin3-like 3 n=1 Tax=Vicia villosa TaxID=3911 RepID=UPI00273A75E2|nr:paired amphipathic helix protein Sin3-like 3 [Vicia villosa]